MPRTAIALPTHCHSRAALLSQRLVLPNCLDGASKDVLSALGIEQPLIASAVCKHLATITTDWARADTASRGHGSRPSAASTGDALSALQSRAMQPPVAVRQALSLLCCAHSALTLRSWNKVEKSEMGALRKVRR